MHSCECLLTHPSPITRARARRDMRVMVGQASVWQALDPAAIPIEKSTTGIWKFADGSWRMPNGTVLDPKGDEVGCGPAYSQVGPTDPNTGVLCVPTQGGVLLANGDRLFADGSMTFADGRKLSADGQLTTPGGCVMALDGTILVQGSDCPKPPPSPGDQIATVLKWTAVVLGIVVLGKVL